MFLRDTTLLLVLLCQHLTQPQFTETMTTHPGRMLEFGELLRKNASLEMFETDGFVTEWKPVPTTAPPELKDLHFGNESGNSSADGPNYFPIPVKATLGILSGLTSLITVGGNLLVITAFFVERNLRTPTNYFIASLAVTDVLIGLASMNLYTLYLFLGYWPLGVTACNLWLSLDYSACLISQYTVFFITLDRFFSVKIPAKYRNWRTEGKVILMVAVTWVIPVILFFSIILGWSHFYPEDKRNEDLCEAAFSDNGIFVTILTICYFWVTLVVMSCLYVGIYRVAVDLQKRADAKRQKVTSLFSMAGQTMSRIGVSLPHHGMNNGDYDTSNKKAEYNHPRNSSAFDSENDSGLVKSQPTQQTDALALNRSVGPLETSFGVNVSKPSVSASNEIKTSSKLTPVKRNSKHCDIAKQQSIERSRMDEDNDSVFTKYECASLNSNVDKMSCCTLYSVAHDFSDSYLQELSVSHQDKLFEIKSPILPDVDEDEQGDITRYSESTGGETEPSSTVISPNGAGNRYQNIPNDQNNLTLNSIKPMDTNSSPKTIGGKPKEEDECHFYFDPPTEIKTLTAAADNTALLKASSPIWKSRLFEKGSSDITQRFQNSNFLRGKGKNYRTSCTLMDRPRKSILQKCQSKLCCKLTKTRKAKVERGRSENRARKALRTISFILGAFVFCWTPYHVIVLLHAYNKQWVNVHLYNISYWLCYMNSPINPFCYALANTQFKKTFLRILKFDIGRT